MLDVGSFSRYFLGECYFLILKKIVEYSGISGSMFGRKADDTHKKRRRFALSLFPSQDPVKNLSLEHALFSSEEIGKHLERLSFYIDEPAVVIGKHQNPWNEVSLDVLLEGRLAILRRFSGGGTVFHDRGNVNWSFISRKEGFSQEENLQIIADLAAEYSALAPNDFSIGERGDVFWRGKKVSGNALAFRGEKVLHHGTLLVDSDLGKLGNALGGLTRRYPGIRIEGAAVASNPSPVISLSRAAGRELSAEGFVRFALGGDSSLSGMSVDSHNGSTGAGGLPRVPKELIELYRSTDWHFRRTPAFRIIIEEGVEISVEKGVAAISIAGKEENMRTCDLLNGECLRWLDETIATYHAAGKKG